MRLSCAVFSWYDDIMFKDLPEGKTHSENDGCGEPAHNAVSSVSVFIYPMSQIFMDFRMSLLEENPDGKTKIINYGEWAYKAIELMQACYRFRTSVMEWQKKGMLCNIKEGDGRHTFNADLPMGASQWLNHGKKLNYAEFFEEKAFEAGRKEGMEEAGHLDAQKKT